MINVEINGNAPEHVDRLTPQINVDDTGRISWIPGFIDYNAGLYPRGKQITSEEFNEALLKSVFQGNYLTDSMNDLLNNHLNIAISRTFKSAFNLVPSYIKVFGTEDWGAQQDDGYYYLTITPEEHGFIVNTEEAPTERMNIDTEMYLLDSEGNFYEVSQVTVDILNNVVLYTDDNALIGFVVVRTNDKSYALADTLIDATQIVGLAKVATSAKYTDLIDRTNVEGTGPDDRINRNTKNINAILLGQFENGAETKVAKASQADYATESGDAGNLTGTIRNIPLDNIFVPGSSEVRQALEAYEADHADSADKATNADVTNLDPTSTDTISLQIGTGLAFTKTITHVASANKASIADTPTLTDNSTNIATTAFVTNKVQQQIDATPIPAYTPYKFNAVLYVEEGNNMHWQGQLRLSAYGVKYYKNGKWYWIGSINGSLSQSQYTRTNVKQIELRNMSFDNDAGTTIINKVINGGIFIQKTHDDDDRSTSIFYDVESTRLNDSGKYNMCRYYAEQSSKPIIFESGVNIYILITDVILELNS